MRLGAPRWLVKFRLLARHRRSKLSLKPVRINFEQVRRVIFNNGYGGLCDEISVSTWTTRSSGLHNLEREEKTTWTDGRGTICFFVLECATVGPQKKDPQGACNCRFIYIYFFFSLLWNIFFMKRLTQFHVEHFCYAPKRMESLFSKEQFALGVFCFFLIMDRNADGMFFVVFPLLSIWWWTMLVITLLPSGFSCFSGSTPSYCVSWVR